MIVVGAASSGEDISLEIASVADIVILSFKNPPKPTSLPSNIHQRSPIKEVDNDGRVVFDDGSVFKVDIIVFCTGYLYEFPFLAPECKIKVKNKRVFPLYKHLFNIIYPSMAFLGLTRHGLTIPVFHLQAQFVVCVLSGKKTLPTQSEMEIDTDNEIKDRSDIGLPEKHFHSLGERRWEYFRAISMLSGCEPVSKLVKNIYHEIIHQRKTNLLNYKTGNYKELNNEEFIELEPKLERKELPASYTAIFGTKCPCPCPNCSSSFNLN